MALVQYELQRIARPWLAVVILLMIPGVRGVEDNAVPAVGGVPVAVRQLDVSVNTKRLANVLSDEFVSFHAKPQDIFDGQGNPISETSFFMAESLGGTFLKVVADSSQLHLQTTGGHSVIGTPDNLDLVQIKADAWKAFYEWARRAKLVPVFVLDYPTDGGKWNAKNALRLLSAASGMGIVECRWQLGNGHVQDAVKYADDLQTFRTMLQAFPAQQWTLVSSELNPQSVPLEEVQYFHANADNLVDAVTMSRSLYGNSTWNYTSLQRDIHLRGFSKQRLPLWLDLVPERTEARGAMDQEQPPRDGNECCRTCLREGLEYARALGESARGGASVVFQSLRRADVQQYTFNFLIALLYKRTVGHKVFPVVSDDEPSRTSVYAYCSRNRTGSITLVVVNEQEQGATNTTIKLSTRSSSSPVELFLLSVQDGRPVVNNRPLEDATVSQLEPVTAVTSLAQGVSFYVPAQTILFAVVPGVQLRECRTDGVPQRKKVPRELLPDRRTSTDLLLEDLIGEMLERAPIDALQRRRRSVVVNDRTARTGGFKRKRFHDHLAGAAQNGDLAEGLSKALENAQPVVEPTERTARGPRQTQAYKRQQRRIRKREKLVEKRNLRKMKHPLREARRERPKRGDLANRRANNPQQRFHDRLLKRMSAKMASRKTKRSSLAEAVNEPPSFTGSDEDDEMLRRSDFPLGDVHLVISKGASGDGEMDYVALDDEVEPESEERPLEYRKPDRRMTRHRPAVRRRVTINQRDFNRFAPVWERKVAPVESEEETDCPYRRSLRRGVKEPEARETRRRDRFMTIEKESRSEELKPRESSEAHDRETFTVAKPTSTEQQSETEQEGMESTEVDQRPVDEVTAERVDASSGEEEMVLFTPAPRTSEERIEPSWSSLESESAEVAELPEHHQRYKRAPHPPADIPSSPESVEVERLEDFFRTNAKLQQKFAEMFDLLLEAIEELESEENDGREVEDNEDDTVQQQQQERGSDANEAKSRTKRNALLHPQAWESRERSNMIHRRYDSEEEYSSENMIVPEPARATGGQSTRPGNDHPPGDNEEGKPGAAMLRSVVNFMRRATSEFHNLFTGWFSKTS